MSRPSHWILAFVLLASAGAVVLQALGWFPPRDDQAMQRRLAPLEPVEPRAPRAIQDETQAGMMGRILDRLGNAVAGAEVRNLVTGEVTRCDAGGRFVLRASPRRTHRLLLQAERHEPAIAQLVPEATPIEAVFVLADARPWLVQRSLVTSAITSPLAGEGHVRDRAGQGVSGAVVAVRETGVAVLTDETGRYRLPLPDGSVHLVTHTADGRYAESDPFAPTRHQGLVPLPDLHLEEGGAVVRGRLRDADGNPCPGAVLHLVAGGLRRRAQTDDGGAFVVAGLPAGECVLQVLPYRGLPGLEQRLVAAGTHDVELTLQRPDPLQVRVVDRSEVPQPDKLVVAHGGEQHVQAVTDTEGRAVLHGLLARDLAFEVRDAKTFELLPLVASDAATRTLTIR